MIREILFRGKRVDNGEWISGSFVAPTNLFEDRVFILEKPTYGSVDNGVVMGRFIEVHPETVGQFTGLRDKNGNRVFEGDWCRACFRDKNGFHYKQGRIIMDDYMWCLDTMNENDMYLINRLHDFEILSNIHDNPELTQ